jgi:hypothetical protein
VTAPDVLPHLDAVQAALVGADLVVGLGGAPTPVPASQMYVALYSDPGQSVSESRADARTDFMGVVQATCVGPTAEQALWVTGRVRSALHAPLVVDGRVAWRPEELGGPPLQRDDSVTPPLYFLPVQYRLRSTT